MVLSWYCLRYVWYLGIHEMSALSPIVSLNPRQSATMSSPRHHQETPRHAQIPPNSPKIAPVSPSWRTHLYPFVLYSTVQRQLKPVHLPHYQIYHQTATRTTKTTTRTTSTNQIPTKPYQTTPYKILVPPFIDDSAVTLEQPHAIPKNLNSHGCRIISKTPPLTPGMPHTSPTATTPSPPNPALPHEQPQRPT